MTAYAADPTLLPRVFTLLDVAFPGVGPRHAQVAALGGSWATCSTPFVLTEGETVVSHVGLVPSPLRIGGQDVDVGCIHAVATLPSHRGRGLYKKLMAEALAHAAPRFQTLVLTTTAPELYQPFGFQVVEENVFEAAPIVPSAPPRESVVLDLAAKADRAVFDDLLARRTPVSNLLGVRSERPIFLFNECSSPLRHVPSLDVIVVAEHSEGRLRLFDVIGPRQPPLADLLAALPAASAVELYFSPDRLAAPATARRHGREHLNDSPVDTLLMARGPFAPGGPCMLPRSART